MFFVKLGLTNIMKLAANDLMFMTELNVETCIKCIKIKNCEGYDRIPQRIIVDGLMHLLGPLSKLFEAVYCVKSHSTPFSQPR